MTGSIQKSIQHSFDDIFTEVTHSEKLGLRVPEQLRLFYLDIQDNRFDLEKMKTALYMNFGAYAFSRAAIDKFTKMGAEHAIINQAQRILKEKGPDVKGAGTELGELLNYVFMEEKLNAPKLMSRVELSTDGASFKSRPDNIHLLSAGTTGLAYHQMIFGASSIMGDLGYAIDEAFARIIQIEQHQKDEMGLVDHLILDTPTDRFARPEDIQFLQELFIPVEGKKMQRITSYAVFLGYSIGLDPESYNPAEFPDLVEEKVVVMLQRYLPIITRYINDYHLTMKSFYFFIVPFNDAEEDKKKVMEDILKGDVQLWPI